MIESLPELRESLAGTVIGPDDTEYDAARRCYNALIDRRPAVIARCVGPRDVAAAFDFAREEGLEVAVRGGGHNPAGHCVLDGGLVIDLTLMRTVSVDAEAGIVNSEGGATWLDFDTATQTHGLVTPGGVVGSTGVAGLCLGGGIGHLISQHGLTCDNLAGAELVTPDGTVVYASAEDDHDLLWALRGAGGNFGVATKLAFRLHRLDRVVGGMLVFVGKGVREGLQRFREVVARSPSELSCQAGLRLDESQEPLLWIVPTYTGPSSDPDELRELRSISGRQSDGIRAHTFMDQQRRFDSPYGEERAYWKGHFVRDLPDELIDVLIERIAALGRPPGGILLESLHGAPKDVDQGAAVVGWRGAAFNISAMAGWQDAELDDEHIAWTRDTAAAIEPWAFGGGYVNYMQADEPVERVRAAFGDAAFERLQALKRRYDPDNVLRRNQNIPPN
jgi:FAD/FMN-containing dehydrogenase